MERLRATATASPGPSLSLHVMTFAFLTFRILYLLERDYCVFAPTLNQNYDFTPTFFSLYIFTLTI